MESMKPCPICGNEPKVFSNGTEIIVSCLTPGCGLRLAMPMYHGVEKTRERIEMVWNKRSEEEKLLASIDLLSGQIEQDKQIIERLQENQSRLYQAFMSVR